MADEGITESIYDTLKTDGRVELEELKIEFPKGVISPRCYLPDNKKRVILPGGIRDTPGFQDTIVFSLLSEVQRLKRREE
jgi:hypothetical protein